MSLSLNATLATAQDSTNRKPICSIMSSSRANEVPFAGHNLTSQITDQRGPAIITHSTRGIYSVYADNSQEDLKFHYTDTDRIEWTNVTLVSAAAHHTIRQPAICELTNGNLGIVYTYNDTVHNINYLKYIIVDSSGTIVTAATTIASYAEASYLIDAPALITLANDDYVLVYEHKNVSTGVYSLMKRTSSDFTSWSSESAITLTGLTTTRGKYHPFLNQISNDDLFLYFTYVDDVDPSGKELTNIYYIISTDNGVTWDTPTAATSYDTFAITATHPCAVQKEADQQHLAYTQEVGALHINKTADNWEADGCGTAGYAYDWVHYDSATNKLYILAYHSYVGIKRICGVNVIDVNTWIVEKSYTSTSLPSYNDYFKNVHLASNRNRGDGHYVAFGAGKYFTVINDEAETINLYAFADNATYGITKNLESSNIDAGESFEIETTIIDATNNRCYVFLYDSYLYKRSFCFGYVDLTETADPEGMYTWHEIYYEYRALELDEYFTSADCIIVPEEDYFIITCARGGGYKSILIIYQLSTGTEIKRYTTALFPLFHTNGARNISYQDGCIYGVITYTTDDGQGDKRGIMKINITTDAITYQRPTWATLDDYSLIRTIAVGSNELIITGTHGISFYYTDTDTWFLYDKDNVPGLDPNNQSSYFDCAYYDRPNNRIFCGRLYSAFLSWTGVVMFYLGGLMQKPYYSIGTYTTQWDWATANQLVSAGWSDEAVITLDENDSIWALWVDGKDSSEFRLKYDNEGDMLELMAYVPDGTDVSVSWAVDRLSTLTFQLANGYLFDPHNNLSTLSTKVQKNRKLDIRFGETVDGDEYWHNQGTFFVTNSKISYTRGEDPIISIEAEDIRSTWSYANIVATQNYDGVAPLLVIDDVLTTHLYLEAGDINLPGSISNSHNVWHQFIEMTGKDIIDTLLDHFGYVSFVDVDGKITLKEITKTAATDHSYSDNTKIITFSPDDSYSTNTNRITVKSETLDYIEVVYAEEAVGELNGTIGWWGGTDRKTIYFSDDHKMDARDPRLVVSQSVSDFKMYGLKGGGKEFISTVEDKYVIVTIEAPDLVDEVIFFSYIMYLTAVYCIDCDFGYCGWCMFFISLELSIVVAILGAVAMYAYEVWAKPVGEEKQSIEAVWNDTEHQNELKGIIIGEEIEDPLCYSISECQRVADYEGMVTQSQRSRIMISKIAHLQDEICDTINFVHPYSSETLKMFITELTRVFKKSDRASSDGYFLDNMVGWKI
jgi:hypothetical protein